MMTSDSHESKIDLRSRVTCPHCWQAFAPEETFWVSQHPDLVDDPRLGSDQQQRFLPTRFNVDGNAIDTRGMVCHELACPRCHLVVPRALFEMGPLFVSIIGTPSCGKSYFLASMTWRLREVLPKHFLMAFGDADPTANKILNYYEEIQFFNARRDQLVKLAKTQEQGDLYDSVRYGDQVVSYPRPFLFALRPLPHHPLAANHKEISRVLCLYDNAGESFEPGKDTAVNPVTRHLARSQLLLFLFDPTQDPRFRDACRGTTEDPQVTQAPVTSRQDIVLHEVADRVRRHAGLGQNERHRRPLIVVVTKYDAWWPLLGSERIESPWAAATDGTPMTLDLDKIDEVSRRLRQLLWQATPELVSAAEGFVDQVLYVPISATGRGPEIDPETGQMGVRPRDINPMWVEMPLLLPLSMWGRGMIRNMRRSHGRPVSSRDGGDASGGQRRSTMWPPDEPRATQPS